MITALDQAKLLVTVAYADEFPAFVAALIELSPGFDVENFLMKPYKWEREAVLWYEHGCPGDPASDDMGAWIEACDQLASA